LAEPLIPTLDLRKEPPSESTLLPVLDFESAEFVDFKRVTKVADAGLTNFERFACFYLRGFAKDDSVNCHAAFSIALQGYF
jgi:hypothetical protein